MKTRCGNRQPEQILTRSFGTCGQRGVRLAAWINVLGTSRKIPKPVRIPPSKTPSANEVKSSSFPRGRHDLGPGYCPVQLVLTLYPLCLPRVLLGFLGLGWG